jgi:hypothetical protein
MRVMSSWQRPETSDGKNRAPRIFISVHAGAVALIPREPQNYATDKVFRISQSVVTDKVAGRAPNG